MPNPTSRLVLNFPGFEKADAVHQIQRLAAGGQKTGAVWNFELTNGEIATPTLEKAHVTFQSSSGDWDCETRYVHFSWSDIIDQYEDMAYPASLLFNLPKYLAFFADGTVNKYRNASFRYWIFTIFPFVMMVLFGFAAWWIVSFLGFGWEITTVLSALLFLVFFKWPFRWPSDLGHLNLTINDWGFARDMVTGSNPKIEQRYETFANELISEISRSKDQELIIVGHSFGSVWAVAALARALEKEPDLLAGKRVTFLALGSSLLKIALVWRAAKFRNWIEQILKQDGLLWHEIQTKTDFISFYKSDPFEPLGLTKNAAEVIVDRVNFKHALSDERLKKMRRSIYLAHRQYILYSDKPVHFDFQLRLFGPYFADDLARDVKHAFGNTNSNLRADVYD